MMQTRSLLFSLTFSPFKLRSPPVRSKPRFSTTRMSSSQSVVEHVVLVKVKDETEPTKVDAMVKAMNSLTSLDGVLHLTAGPILRNGPTSSFTHMLHSRYHSKHDLQAYNAHPTHVAVARGFVFPVSDDIMIVDWVAGKTNLKPPATGSSLRVRFLKLKGDGGDDHDEVKEEVLRVVGGTEEGVGELSYGVNFSPERAKGFSIASLAVFPGRKEVESVDMQEGLVKVVEHVEDVVVVDYVVP